MNFNNEFPEWGNEGTPPPTSLQTSGFSGGEKPPAAWLNWLCSLIAKCVKELQTKLSVVNKSTAHIVEATSTDGALYTATVEGITELYNGLELTIIPNMTSTKTAVQFNLNGLGAKNLRIKIDGYNSGNAGTISALATWIGENYPLTIRYVSKFDMWQTVDFTRQSVSGLYGTVKIEGGGTGADTAEEARENLGAQSKITSGTAEPTGGVDGDVYIQIIN